MPKFIKPVSVQLQKGDFGYSVAITKINRLRQRQAEVSLGSVLDLGYARAVELQELLEKFLEDQPCIMACDDAEIRQELKTETMKLTIARNAIKQQEARVANLRARIANIEACDDPSS